MIGSWDKKCITPIDLLTNGLRVPHHPAYTGWHRYRVSEKEFE